MLGRCPEHPEEIQPGYLGGCMEWVGMPGRGGEKMRCGRHLVPLSVTDLQEIQNQRLKEKLETTTFPSWMVAAIQEIAYDQGHSAGKAEVDNYVLEWLSVFETHKNKD